MLIFLAGVVVGACAVLLLAYAYFFNPLGGTAPPLRFSEHYQPSRIPPVLQRFLKSNEDGVAGSKWESCFTMSLIFHFLYQEHKDSRRFRRWFHKRLELELNDLTTRTTAGRLIQDVRIRDLCLGSQVPIINSARVEGYQMSEDSEGFESLNLLIDLDYSGGFQASVDVSMVLGRYAQMSIKVARLSGKARLTFTREPFTHWTFAFVEMPFLDFKIDSRWQGKPLRHVVPLITQQFRRVLQRKHVWPNYKIRYRPFFPNPLMMPSPPIGAFDHVTAVGGLEVTVLQCTRLNLSLASSEHDEVYCTLAIDQRPFLHCSSPNSVHCITVLLNFVRHGFADPLGLTFSKSVAELGLRAVLVSSVEPQSTADKCGFKEGDVLLAVNNVPIRNERQAARLLCSTAGELSVLVERSLQDSSDPDGDHLGVDQDDVIIRNGMDDEEYLLVGGAKQIKNAIIKVEDVDDELTATASSRPRSSPLGFHPRRHSSSSCGGGRTVGDVNDQRSSVAFGDETECFSDCFSTSAPPTTRGLSNRKAEPESDLKLPVELRKTRSNVELMIASSWSSYVVDGDANDNREVESDQFQDALDTEMDEFCTQVPSRVNFAENLRPRQLSTSSAPAACYSEGIAKLHEADSLSHDGVVRDKERPPSRREKLQARAAEMAAAGRAKVSDLWYRKREENPQIEIASEAVAGEELLETAVSSTSDRKKDVGGEAEQPKRHIILRPKRKGKRLTESAESAPSDDGGCSSLKSAEEERPHSRSTRCLQLSENVLWGQSLHFDLNPKTSRYLNVTVHSRSKVKKDASDRDEFLEESSARPAMLGYASIFIPQAIDDCQLTVSNGYREVFTLRQPLDFSVKRATSAAVEESTRHAGFDPRLCFGDVLLGFRYFPSGLPHDAALNPDLENSSDEDMHSEQADSMIEKDAASDSISSAGENSSQPPSHNFQFVTLKTATAVCAVCHGKVWLKSASRCARCLTVCHNKCVAKAIDAVPVCSPSQQFDDAGFEILDDSCLTGIAAPAFPVEEVLERPDATQMTLTSPVVSSVDSHCVGVERTLSRRRRFVNNVSEKLGCTWSKVVRKKASPVTSEAELLRPAVDEPVVSRPVTSVESVIPDVFAKLNISGVLGSMMYQPGNAYNEKMIGAAKDVGKDMFAELEPAERKAKINEQMELIQGVINKTTAKRLCALGECKEDGEEGSEFASLEERLQALAVLMLHYCAALQNCLDREEELAANSQETGATAEFAAEEVQGTTPRCSADKVEAEDSDRSHVS